MERVKMVIVGGQVYFCDGLSNELRSYQRKVLGWMALESMVRKRKGVDVRLPIYAIREGVRIDDKTLLKVLGKLTRKGLVERVARGVYKIKSDAVYISEAGRLLKDVEPHLF